MTWVRPTYAPKRVGSEPHAIRAAKRVFVVLDQKPGNPLYVGEVWFGPAQIHIDPTLHCNYRQEVLLHELMHVAGHYDERGKVRGEAWPADEDGAIERVAPTLLRMLQDNPELGNYLTERKCGR